MKPLLTLLLSLLCLTASASPGQPYFVRKQSDSSPFNPESVLPNTMKFWYKATDLSNSPVAIWTDRISGFNWVASGAAQPTWDTNGVHFDGANQSFVATNNQLSFWTSGGNSTFLLIHKWNSSTSSQLLLGNNISGGEIIIYRAYYEGSVGDHAVWPVGNGYTIDFLVARTSDAPTYQAFTNGVASQWSQGSTWNGSANLTKVGKAITGGFANADIMEFIVWTNTTAWSATTISNIHWYATNTWKFAP